LKGQPHRLYRDAQSDYWEGRARRARRTLAFRRFLRVVLALVIIAVVVAVAGYIAHRADPSMHVPGYSTTR
jgi:hypothetical protein